MNKKSTNFVARWVPQATYFHKYNSDDAVSSGEWTKGILLMALFIIGAWYLNTGGLALLFYVGLTVGVLIFYYEQYGGTRYLTPIMPILIFLLLSGVCGIFSLIYKIAKIKSSPWILQALTLLIITFGFLSPTFSKEQEQKTRKHKIVDFCWRPADGELP